MKGSYVLVIKVRKVLKKLKVGDLGKIDFMKGFYCYIGSAMGKTVNIENRLRRHFQSKKKIKWHIDYLLASPFVFLEGVIIFPSKKRLECIISRKIEKFSDGIIINFGSSDCNCKGHLYYFRSRRKLANTLMKI
jgi:Uri superfamily endonuclease